MSLLAGQLGDLAVLLRQRKHQPGRHDQKRHDPHKGAGVTVVGKDDYEERRIRKALESLPDDEVALLKAVKYDPEGVVRAKVHAGVSREEARTGALLTADAEVLYAGRISDRVIRHEVGHLVYHNLLPEAGKRAIGNHYAEQRREYKRLKKGRGIPGNRRKLVAEGVLSLRAMRGVDNPKLYKGERGVREFHAEAYADFRANPKAMERHFPELYDTMVEYHSASSTSFKHQAGRHDQSKHTPQAFLGRAAAASMTVGTPVTMDWLSQPSQEVLFNELSLLNAAKAKRALVMAKINQEDMVGLRRITTRLFPGYTYDHQRVLLNRDGMPCSGSYRTDGSILISPHRFLDRPSKLADTMRHEIGHHKLHQMGLQGGNRKYKARQVIRRANLKSYSNDQLGNAGLRTYSTTSGGELLADTFVVMGLGTPEQKKLLLNIWGEGDFDSLEQIYKQMLGMMYANEIRAVSNDDGTVDFVEAPVLVERAIYEKTPWYYTDAR